MSYDEPRYLARIPVSVPSDGIVSTGVFTASGHVLTATNVDRMEFNRACVVQAGRCFTATAATSATNKVVLMRGTNTVASATAAAVNSGADFASFANNTFTAGEQLGINIIHTGTASASQASVAVDLMVEYQEQFA